jgi:hypothetical protein
VTSGGVSEPPFTALVLLTHALVLVLQSLRTSSTDQAERIAGMGYFHPKGFTVFFDALTQVPLLMAAGPGIRSRTASVMPALVPGLGYYHARYTALHCTALQVLCEKRLVTSWSRASGGLRCWWTRSWWTTLRPPSHK